ncbi:MAG: aldo/keto reductase, partial [Gammaproteobacteria bacterium]|nr:aldo/keto reductase [Gammaproteobacteria bacterium]
LAELAAELAATPAQLALAWLLSRGPDIVPIPATRRAGRVDENVAAAELCLSSEQLERLDRAFPPGVAAGTRYPQRQLAAMGI